MTELTPIELTVNGKSVRAKVAPRTHLADFLREYLFQTGTHIGCEHGICGACTVEIDGEISRSCITYAASCDGANIRTIEGFDDDALMARLRAAFMQEHALQCGYCTPGMLVAARDLIRRKGGLSRQQIRVEMSGNLCRCTGYFGIVSAIETVMAARDSIELPPVSAKDQWLGPAPGPSKTRDDTPPPSGSKAGVAQRASAGPVSATAIPAPAPMTKRRRIKVEVGFPEEADGETRLNQSFVLEQPREAVWRIMSDPRAVAACMPGMVVDSIDEAGHATGRMEIGLGPIKASFAGKGAIERFDADYRQVIAGSGGDRKSGSNASGTVDYRLHAIVGAVGEEATRVDVAMSYALTGPLAQFGRSSLVRDLVSRIGESFAQNIDARISAPDSAVIAPASLSALSLVWGAVMARARGGLARLFGRRGR